MLDIETIITCGLVLCIASCGGCAFEGGVAMISLLPDSFIDGASSIPVDLSDFEYSAAALNRELLWLFWAGAIDSCVRMVDSSTRLIGAKDPFEYSGPAQIAKALKSMRSSYAPRLIMRDERHEVVSLGTDACVVLSHHAMEETGPDGSLQRRPTSPNGFLCSTVWTRNEDGECKLVLWSWRGFTESAKTIERPLDRLRSSNSPIGTLRDSGDSANRQPALQARGTDGVTHWIQPDSIIYVAAAHQYTDIYCTDRRMRLSSVVVRVHRSYAVNPAYISRFEQDSLYLTTGAVIPIPAKRLREVRHALQEHFNKLGKRD